MWTMSKGVGVLVNVLKAEGDDVTRVMSIMSKGGGGVLVNVFTPLQEILYPRLVS